MSHPNVLLATATACALHAARWALTVRAAVEANSIAAEQWATRTNLGIRSTVLTGRSGGYGDPISRAALDHTEPAERTNRWHAMAQRAERRITGIADLLGLDGDGDPLERILAAIPGMRPATAAAAHRHLVDEDAWIRRALDLPPALEHLTGQRCPVCRVAQLYRHTADPSRPIVCRADCLCRGSGCPCGMSVVEEGAPHIWPASHPAVTTNRAAA